MARENSEVALIVVSAIAISIIITFGQAYHCDPTQAYQTQEIPEPSTVIGTFLVLELGVLSRKQKAI
ncbi:PEP-CTERM sorting domain-containing protein [Hydrococcus rivularis]|uniref:PEP-CTERM sorting domain-containing protein n=1 Tax=Hydrococcus rivularis TaxID=1616834 RepID=UPI0009FA526B